MARALLLGCGCAARWAGRELLERGWAVRGSTRASEGRAAIDSAGIESCVCDPDRVGTVIAELGDVTILAWLFGSASGDSEQLAALHGPRLERTLEKIVDTPVRGFLYEATGSVGAEVLEAGAEQVEAASSRWRIPAEILRLDRSEVDRFSEGVADAADRLIGR